MAKVHDKFASAFGRALQALRKRSGLTQEDFGSVSSRTYLSTLERGEKNPTVGKLNDLCGLMEIHPLTLLTLAYANERQGGNVKQLLRRVEKELEGLGD